MLLLLQRALIALCLLYLSSCSTVTCRQWELQEILTQTPRFNGGRIILGADSDYSHLELEINRNRSGFRFYINLLFLHAPPWKEDPSRTTVEVKFEDQESWIIHPFVFEGNQRLLLPGDIADTLIQALCQNKCFTIQIGRNQISVIPDNFSTVYTQLLTLPIDEDPILYQNESENET